MLSMYTTAFAVEKAVPVTVERKLLTFEVEPYVKNGRTMVELKSIVASLSGDSATYSLEWDNKNNMILISTNEYGIYSNAYKDDSYPTFTNTKYIILMPDSINVQYARKYSCNCYSKDDSGNIVDNCTPTHTCKYHTEQANSQSEIYHPEILEGVWIDPNLGSQLDVAPEIVNGRTMVPLRFIAEQLGLQVLYNKFDKEILIGNPQGDWMFTKSEEYSYRERTNVTMEDLANAEKKAAEDKKKAAENKKKLSEEADALFAKVKVGDTLRVTGNSLFIYVGKVLAKENGQVEIKCTQILNLFGGDVSNTFRYKGTEFDNVKLNDTKWFTKDKIIRIM